MKQEAKKKKEKEEKLKLQEMNEQVSNTNESEITALDN